MLYAVLGFDEDDACCRSGYVVDLIKAQGFKDLMPIEFDLAYPGDNAEAFESLGFPTGDKVINATNLTFDISQFIPLLSAFPGNHTFTLNLTDNKSVNKIVSLKFIAK